MRILPTGLSRSKGLRRSERREPRSGAPVASVERPVPRETRMSRVLDEVVVGQMNLRSLSAMPAGLFFSTDPSM